MDVNALQSIAIGYQSNSFVFNRPAEILIGDKVGYGGSGAYRIDIGNANTVAGSGSSIVMGTGINTSGTSAVVIGNTGGSSTAVPDDFVISIGNDHDPQGDFSILVGTTISSSAERTIVMGDQYSATNSYTFNVGFDSDQHVMLSHPNALVDSYINSDLLIGAQGNSTVSTLEVNGSLSLQERDVTGTSAASENVVDTDFGVFATSTSGTLELNLPQVAAVPGIMYGIARQSGGTEDIRIEPDGVETINGDSSYTLLNQYDSLLLQSNGVEWKIVASHLPSQGGMFNVAPELKSAGAVHPVKFTTISGTSNFNAVDDVYCALIRCNKQVQVASLKNRYAIPSGSGTVRMGIYTHNATTWKPWDLIAASETSVTVNSSSMTAYSDTVLGVTALAAGDYFWVVMVADDNTITAETYVTADNELLSDDFSGSTFTKVTGVRVNFTGASTALPARLNGSYVDLDDTTLVYPTLILS
jgi:hypothetical protein